MLIIGAVHEFPNYPPSDAGNQQTTHHQRSYMPYRHRHYTQGYDTCQQQVADDARLSCYHNHLHTGYLQNHCTEDIYTSKTTVKNVQLLLITNI